MAWVNIVLTFVAIPAALFALVTITVLWLSDARTPDGIAAAQAAANRGGSGPPETANPQLATPTDDQTDT